MQLLCGCDALVFVSSITHNLNSSSCVNVQQGYLPPDPSTSKMWIQACWYRGKKKSWSGQVVHTTVTNSLQSKQMATPVPVAPSTSQVDTSGNDWNYIHDEPLRFGKVGCMMIKELCWLTCTSHKIILLMNRWNKCLCGCKISCLRRGARMQCGPGNMEVSGLPWQLALLHDMLLSASLVPSIPLGWKSFFKAAWLCQAGLEIHLGHGGNKWPCNVHMPVDLQ